MATLHLGVLDIPYPDEGGITTHEVAEILERRYHIMEVFFTVHEKEVADSMADSVAGALDAIMNGADKATFDPLGEGMSEIEEKFREFLSLREMDQLGVPGVPTEAARRGVSHRFKRPYVKRAERPSFIDTGLYQSVFRAWVDNE